MKPIPFYLAGPFNRREAIREVRTQLEATGALVCTSRWIDTHADDVSSPNILRQEALSDLEDIRNAQWFILWNEGPSTTGGMHFETGYAFALKKVVIVIGAPTSVFYHLTALIRVHSIADVLKFVPSWLYGSRTLPKPMDQSAV